MTAILQVRLRFAPQTQRRKPHSARPLYLGWFRCCVSCLTVSPDVRLGTYDVWEVSLHFIRVHKVCRQQVLCENDSHVFLGRDHLVGLDEQISRVNVEIGESFVSSTEITLNFEVLHCSDVDQIDLMSIPHCHWTQGVSVHSEFVEILVVFESEAFC